MKFMKGLNSAEIMGKYDFETGTYRPPSEGGSYSLLIRFTRNCPWNRCGFCGMYKTEKFEVRTVAEIKRDIDARNPLTISTHAGTWIPCARSRASRK